MDPGYFDLLCKIVREWSGYDETVGKCQTASVPRRLFKTLKVCSQLLLSNSLKCKLVTEHERKIVQKKHDHFIHLMGSDWSAELCCIGDQSLKKKQYDEAR